MSFNGILLKFFGFRFFSKIQLVLFRDVESQETALLVLPSEYWYRKYRGCKQIFWVSHFRGEDLKIQSADVWSGGLIKAVKMVWKSLCMETWVFSGGRTTLCCSMKRFSVTWSNGQKTPNKQNWSSQQEKDFKVREIRNHPTVFQEKYQYSHPMWYLKPKSCWNPQWRRLWLWYKAE